MCCSSCAGEHFHPYRVADRDLGVKQRLHPLAGRGAGISEKFDPYGRIDQDHDEQPTRISSRSASQPDSRRCLASSTLIASEASVRRARLMASRFVVRRY